MPIQRFAPALYAFTVIGLCLPASAWGAEPSGSLGISLLVAILLLLLLQTLLIVGLLLSRRHNKRAQISLKDTQKELERRIAERTDSLHQMNNQLHDEIAHHQATEILLRETQDYLHSIINSMPSVLIGVTTEGHITHWNSAAELATGLTADEALGQHISAAYPALPVKMDIIARTIDTGVPYVNENIQDGQGSEARYTDLSIYPLIAVQAIGAVIRVDDITMRVRIENMMIQNEKMMSLGELAAGMAHEINNPLSAILHGVQNITRRTSPEFRQNQKVAEKLGISLMQVHAYLQERHIFKFLDHIREAGERSTHIVSNMLEFSHSNNRHRDSFDLVRVIQHSLDLCHNTLDIHTSMGLEKPEIVSDLQPNIPPILGSAAELQQVILNLLRNAIQAFVSEDYGPPLDPKITLRAYSHKNTAVLEVEDNGPGMKEEVRRHIFEPFFTTKEVGKGTGLGLSVSYFIVTEHHSGTIEVDSVPGKGTRFIIRLPFAQSVKNTQSTAKSA
ncbi:nitrogen regulation protein NR(II) [Marinimicrobium sp. ABcell2]|uniref:two-component system sensor histidine kinase NtrB n=1 Tax=Marinimicrobium sp. ABcell2 TaxID=3069751 RepID=UPI0027B0DB31|nr:ATP-binding protein [Marinimicrobium sp. ABcell2]MDQ2078016.1 ATP-binding protein [Marinimicrobium sp. ABcell2]